MRVSVGVYKQVKCVKVYVFVYCVCMSVSMRCVCLCKWRVCVVGGLVSGGLEYASGNK